MNLKAIIFDLDDTLYNEREFVMEGFRAVAEYLSNKYALSEKELISTMQEILIRDGRGKIFNKLCEMYRIEEPIKELVDCYRMVVPSIELYPDAQELLWYLSKRAAIKTGIITDGNAQVQQNKVKALGLYNCIDYVIMTGSFENGYSKPSRKPYQDIIKKLGVEPETAVYIGDNPTKDFIGAKQIGMHTIRIIREQGDHMNTEVNKELEAELKVKELTEVIKFIGSI